MCGGCVRATTYLLDRLSEKLCMSEWGVCCQVGNPFVVRFRLTHRDCNACGAVGHEWFVVLAAVSGSMSMRTTVSL